MHLNTHNLSQIAAAEETFEARNANAKPVSSIAGIHFMIPEDHYKCYKCAA